jgi:L-tartrate/succinate antiporter
MSTGGRVRVLRSIAPLALGVLLLAIPAPAGLAPRGWHYFALFATVVTALITEPLPGPVIGILGITAAAALGLVTPQPDEAIRWALSGFSHSTVWLIFVAFMIGLGYEKTGLGRRIALGLVRALGGRTLGLGYAVALADLVLAPFTPSNTARTGGMIYPIIRSIPGLYDSAPGPTARRIGAYLMWTGFAVSGITSSMFLTANAANLFATSLMKESARISVGWAEWAWGFLPVGLVLFGSMPALAYLVYPPGVTRSHEVPVWAAQELRRMGPIGRGEATMAAIAALALGLWIFGGRWINPTTAALIAFCLMLLGGVLSWRDVVGHRDAWRVLVWFATLVTMADGLQRAGFLAWFAGRITTGLAPIPPTTRLMLLVALFFAAHYMFASLTAHATALLPVFLAAGVAMPDLPARPFALLLCYAIGLMGVLTPYATGPAPIFFASGYISRAAFWSLGGLFGAFFLLVLLALGVPWLL